MKTNRSVLLVAVLCQLCFFVHCQSGSPRISRQRTYKSLEKAMKRKSGVRSLDLSGSGLTHIPCDVFELENLVFLNLADNRISYVPDKIGNLEHLESLILTSNEVNSVSGEIGELKKLRILSFLDNPELKRLPDGMKKLEGLRKLGLIGTSIDGEEVREIMDALPKCTVFR